MKASLKAARLLAREVERQRLPDLIQPTATPLARGAVSLNLSREEADALLLALGARRGSLSIPHEARLFRVYQALHGHFARVVSK